MAKRSYKNKTRSLQPAVMKLHYRVPLGSPDSINYISISESVSRLNRRFYRQGMNWAVANVRFNMLPKQSTSIGMEVYVNTIPHTWSVANAWMKTYALWKKQQDDALSMTDSLDTAARFPVTIGCRSSSY